MTDEKKPRVKRTLVGVELKSNKATRIAALLKDIPPDKAISILDFVRQEFCDSMLARESPPPNSDWDLPTSPEDRTLPLPGVK